MLTEGPFFVDEKLDRRDLRAGTKRSAVVGGKPLVINVKVMKLVGSAFVPFAGAQVDIWHCDASGVYSDVSSPMNHEDTSGEKWLRGFQKTDNDGSATFETIVPGAYPGRAPHIHFKVRKYNADAHATADLTSQMFFVPEQIGAVYKNAPYGRQFTSNLQDSIYNERGAGGGRAGDQLLLGLKSNGKGYVSPFTIVLTDANFREGREDLDWATF